MRQNKKMLFATLVAVVIVFVGYATFRLSENKVSYRTDSLPFVAENLPSENNLLTQDSDSDGLADWEEVLWKTDPKNPDTDGDGISDGDEVKANRDPAVSGTGDLKSRLNEDAIATSTELSKTSQFTRDILTTYLKLKQESETGIPTNAPSLETLVSKYSIPITSPSYTSSQFTSVADTTKAKETYIQNVTAIFSTYLPVNQRNDLEIFQQSLETENKELMEELSQRAEYYQTAARELLSVSVPKTILATHIKLTNTLFLLSETVRLMSIMYSDPVAALTGLNEYQNVSLVFVAYLNELMVYMSS